MGNLLDAVLGTGKKPKTSPAPVQNVEDEKQKKRRSRAALTATQGGVRGEELQTGQVSTDGKLFGN